MSETQTVTKSSSSSIPASLQYATSRMNKRQILDPRPEKADDDVSDLIHVNAAATICVKRREDPVELVLGGVELVHAVSLMLV